MGNATILVVQPSNIGPKYLRNTSLRLGRLKERHIARFKRPPGLDILGYAI